MNYTLCVPHFCVKLKKMKQNKKDDKSITERKKNSMLVEFWSFKLPVLSCSQLLKITGFKNTIYNVLALDRCSTCVTVLIYETKMVTVNYVFLCAFFLKRGRRLSGHGSSSCSCPIIKKKKKTFCFWWNIMETKKKIVSENEKKWKKRKKKRKNIWIYFFS